MKDETKRLPNMAEDGAAAAPGPGRSRARGGTDRRRRLLRRILALRAQAPATSDDEIRTLRRAGRP